MKDGLLRIYRRLFIPYVILGFLTGLKPSYLHRGVIECLEKSIRARYTVPVCCKHLVNKINDLLFS